MSYTDKALYLDVSIQTERYINIGVESNIKALDLTIDSSGGGYLPYYEGEYIVEPRKVQQELETAQKSMRENVVVLPIYYSEVSNPMGGNTAFIGKE